MRLFKGLLSVVLIIISGASAAAQECERTDLLFVVDRSSSMRERLPTGETKWDAAALAVLSVAESSPQLNLGAMVFPFPDACSPGEVVLTPGPHSPEEVAWVLEEMPAVVGDYTPIAQTLGALEGQLRPASHVVLITDGWQWCAPYDPSMRGAPVEVVERLRLEGHTVHVVGFGTGVDARTLNEAAAAGGAPIMGCDSTLDDATADGHCYHAAHAANALADALRLVARHANAESCDGVDNDCDGAVDEGPDADGDGFSVCAGDCNDLDPGTFPGAPEACDGVDRSCDGHVLSCACDDSATRPCTVFDGVCSGGVQTCRSGWWSVCEGVPAPAPESCQGVDDDCDGVIDEDAPCPIGQRCTGGACSVDLPALPAALPVYASDSGVDAGPPWAPSIGSSCLCQMSSRSGTPWPGLLVLAVFGARRAVRRRAQSRSRPTKPGKSSVSLPARLRGRAPTTWRAGDDVLASGA